MFHCMNRFSQHDFSRNPIKGPDNKNAALVDPITTLLFLVVIIFTTVRVMLDLVKVLMNRCEDGQYDRVLRVLQSVADDIHMLHIWVSLKNKVSKSNKVLILVGSTTLLLDNGTG